MGFSKTHLQVSAAAAALMVALRQVVMKHATRTTAPFGSHALGSFLSKMVGFVASKAGIDFSSNTYEAFHGPNKWLDANRQCVYLWHPHGAFTMCAAMYTSAMSFKSFSDDAPGPKNWFVGIASLLFGFPVLGEFMILMNARPVAPEIQRKILERGCSYAVQPGGIAEQVLTDHCREQVLFPPNLGFVRMALTHGLPLVPIYVFGENQVFTTSEWGRNVTKKLHKATGIAAPLVNPIPNNVTLDQMFGHEVEVGKPIPPSEQTDELVRKVFADYVKALIRLFNEHKDACLPAEVAAEGLSLMWRGHSKEEFESLLAEVHGGELPAGIHVNTGVAGAKAAVQHRSKL